MPMSVSLRWTSAVNGESHASWILCVRNSAGTIRSPSIKGIVLLLKMIRKTAGHLWKPHGMIARDTSPSRGYYPFTLSFLPSPTTSSQPIELEQGPEGWVSFKYQAAAYLLCGKSWKNIENKRLL